MIHRTQATSPRCPAWLQILQVAAGAGVLACFILLMGVGSFAEQRLLATGLMLLAGLGWCLAVWAAKRGAGRIGMILAIALAMRLACLGGDLGLSDDLWRYAWEGGLVMEGQSPYAHAPDSEELQAQRETWVGVYERMNNTDVSAAYPPVTQYWVAGMVWCLSRVARVDVVQAKTDRETNFLQRGLRCGFALLDLLVLLPLWGLLKHWKLPVGLLVVWAWSPLVTWEFASSAHFDSLGILLLTSAVWAYYSNRKLVRTFSIALLASAFLTKYLPLLAAPFLLRRAKLSTGLMAVATFAVCIALGFLSIVPLAGGLSGIFQGVGEYGLRWESWNLSYRWLEPMFDQMGQRNEGLLDPRRIGRLAIGALAGLFVVRLFLRRVDPVHGILLSLAAFLILTPTLHPWYLTWILPFVALAPRGNLWSWLWIAAVSPLLYWPLEGWLARGEWIEPAWSWPVVAVPFFVLMLAEGIMARRSEAARVTP